MSDLAGLVSLTPAERDRLSIYRAAVIVGLDSDNLFEDSYPYRFTPAELARLMAYRAAVAAGFYTDQLSLIESE
jgi:hypothetical protein